jgi:hypothetical protein
MKKMLLLILIIPNLLFAKLYGIQISDTNTAHFSTHECLFCNVEYVQHDHSHEHFHSEASSHSHQHMHAKVMVSVADFFIDGYSDSFNLDNLSKEVILATMNKPSSDFIQELFRPPIA